MIDNILKLRISIWDLDEIHAEIYMQKSERNTSLCQQVWGVQRI